MKFDGTRLWLCLPFVLIFLIDAGLTLSGQPSAYWQGNLRDVNEGFPLFAWGLAAGPAVFTFVCLAWIAVFGVLIASLPGGIAEILSLALVNGHTWGAMTWLVYRFQLDYHLCLLFFVFSASLFIASQHRCRVGQHPGPSGR